MYPSANNTYVRNKLAIFDNVYTLAKAKKILEIFINANLITKYYFDYFDFSHLTYAKLIRSKLFFST